MLQRFPCNFTGKLPGLLALLCLAALAGPAQAADAPKKKAPECAASPVDAIVTLPLPKLGTPPQWSGFYTSKDGSAHALGGAPLTAETIMTVERTVAPDGKNGNLVFAVINNRGRIVRQRQYPIRGGEESAALLPLGGEGYALLGNLPAGGKELARVRLAIYGPDGTLKKEKILTDEDAHIDGLTGHALSLSADGKSFLVAVEASRPEHEKDQYNFLYSFSLDGKLLWNRSYKPGLPSHIYGAMPLESGEWLAFGDIFTVDERWAGMVMRLRADGTMLWQQIYPRGKGAVLRQGVAGMAGDDVPFYYLLGEASPADRMPQALWMLAIDEQGGAVGQRYFRRPDTVYGALAIHRLDDGRFMLAANADPKEGSRQPPHVRILTLSPRAALLNDESYIEGVAAQGASIVFGADGPALAATIRSDGKPLDIEMSGRTFLIREEPPPPPEKEKKEGDDAGKEGTKKGDAAKPLGKAATAAVKAAQDKEKPAVVVEEAPPLPPVYKGWAVMLPQQPPYTDPCSAP